MQQKALPLVALALVACAGDPFASPPGVDAGAERSLDARPDAPPESGAPPVKPPIGFAQHESGGLAAFDRTTGQVLDRHALSGPLLDLAWDPGTGRALCVVQDFENESSVLQAFVWSGSAVEHVVSAEPVTGSAHVWSWRGQALLISEEMSAVWTLLDATLVAAKLGKSLFRPAGLVDAADGALIGLDANRFDEGHDHDAIVRVTHDGAWQLEAWPFPAPDRPGSRFAAASELDTAWLVRKHTNESRYEIAEIDALSPAAPTEFRVLSVPTAPGSLEGVVRIPDRDLLIATLSRDLTSGAGELVMLPLVADGVGAAIPLGAAVASSPWPARHLALDPATERLLVATGGGIEAFAPSGAPATPELAADASFSGAELRAPFALASP
jgi:hypothetical protein